MALSDFGDLALGKIDTTEYLAIQRKEQQEENQRLIAAVVAKYGSWDNYLHCRANQIIDTMKG